MKSLMRKLDTKLFLIVKKNRSDHAWQFPQGKREASENSLRKTAERELREECGSEVDVWFNGNAPRHLHAYEYPPDVQKRLNTYGAKVFFFYAYYIKGPIILNNKELIDYHWVTREEMKEYINPELYKTVLSILPRNIYDF